MTTAANVARYLIWLAGNEPDPELLDHLRLQKLLYYVQGWSLALRGDPMFRERLEAWDHGPVAPAVYALFAEYSKQAVSIPLDLGKEDCLAGSDRDFVNSIWESYREHSGAELRRMTHREPPWCEARGDAKPGQQCNSEISEETLIRYFREVARERGLLELKQETEVAEREIIDGQGISLEELRKRTA